MLDSLPEHLRERTRILNGGEIDELSKPKDFVLYWMQSAVRRDENPALDVARQVANQQCVPLLIYQAISEHYKFASDRQHTFMLQAAREVQKQFRELGLSYAFHLSTHDDRGRHLLTLASMASIVVTEDMPVDPQRHFLAVLENKTSTPIAAVDTACVAPMLLVKQPFTRAFRYRTATKKIYVERLTRAWPELRIETKRYDTSKLPFEPLELQATDIGELISHCAIDHSIGPVVDTVGGSNAGYARWQEFKEQRLSQYAETRNNALLDGVSRMSPYLHYGMVSPFRIAREAAEIDNAGSKKYLDELLIWRELAYAFCFYRDDHDQWSAIPDWARETLTHHADDDRHQIYSWEQLARGETSDQFWNAAQKSLLMQGELHNNVRMTWGKAILNWTATPQKALATIIDLNHRYALDGRDPASFGGILWCLGQFDRPFKPEQKIIGSVRPRPTSGHVGRLDPQKYFEKVSEPRFSPVPHVAVIGAGISGLFAARTLQDHGLKVTVFEKSRGVGGRMSTRRTENNVTFDHGAQYFTARNRDFIRYVESWMQQRFVAKWPDPNLGADQKIVVLNNGKIQSESSRDTRFVGVPTMNAVCKHLADNLDVLTGTRVAQANPVNACVELFDDRDNPLGTFEHLIVSAPAAQTAELLTSYPVLANRIAKLEMNPCWAVMVAFAEPVTAEWVGAFLHDSFLTWAARNNTKPGRDSSVEHLVIHAHPDWTAENWEQTPDKVAKSMLNEFWRVAGITPQPHQHLQAHRWKYAIPVNPSNARCLATDSAVTIACGDWVSGSRVEGAFLSGMAAAGRILRMLSPAK